MRTMITRTTNIASQVFNPSYLMSATSAHSQALLQLGQNRLRGTGRLALGCDGSCVDHIDIPLIEQWSGAELVIGLNGQMNRMMPLDM